MACSVSGQERAFEEFRGLRILQSQGSLTRRRPENADSAQRVARRRTARLRKATKGKPSAGTKSAKGAKRKRNAPDVCGYDTASKTEQRRPLIFQHNYSRSVASRIRRHYVRLRLGGNTHRSSADCCCHPRSMNPELWACEMRIQIRSRQTS